MKDRYNYLDAIRGIAALSVVLFHYTLNVRSEVESSLFGHYYYLLLDDYFDLGKWGVIMFFMLSGMLIPYSIKGDTLLDIKIFSIGRFFRLYPVYWISVLIGGVIFHKEISVILVNLSMFQQFIGIENVIGLYWTLQIELIFYFLIAFGFYFKCLKEERNQFYAAVFFMMISLVFAFLRYWLEMKLPIAAPLAISIMLFGTIWKRHVLDRSILAKKYVRKYIVFFVPALILTCHFGYSLDFGYNENPVKYFLTYSLGVLSFCVLSDRVKIGGAFFVYLGRISYSLYLFHPIIWELVEGMNFKSILIEIFVSIILTIFVSHVLYELVERTFIKIGKAVVNTLSR
ncbi:acyltransferase [Reichenbachiella agarivorans]|uniref:Acyltransferase n=1 Tax=Reichenbachiella agarivorans TaxID=2979464 RepID=A0ABY6CSQ4_9BACT|nr:acyltransferase [Reichenbachiella agarivorans]UXP33549.1 acyltransferase [Reichenbachiella agarivorans]